MRTIAIGDIHGCGDALEKLIKKIKPKENDLIITLGDHLNRGRNTKKVLDILMNLPCKHIPIMGNHEEMLFGALEGGSDSLKYFLQFGGFFTLMSFGVDNPKDIPYEYKKFFKSCVQYHETENFIFTHANYDANKDFCDQPSELLRWKHLSSAMPNPHKSGKTVVVGHSVQDDGVFDSLGYLICLDTGAGVKATGGKLSALDVTNNVVYQVKADGN